MKLNEVEKLIATMLEVAIDHRKYACVRLLSPPGIGKSSVVYQAAARVAKARGIKVGVKLLRLNEREQPDIKGYGLPPDGNVATSKMQFSLPSWAVSDDEPKYGILFLDEQPQSNDDVNKASAEIMLNRAVDHYQLPEGWIVVAAGNREQDKSGARKTMAFIQNRISDIHVEPSKDVLVEWMEVNGIHHAIISFTEAFPGVVFGPVPDKPGPFCTPRSICMLSPYIDVMPMGMFTEFAQGAIGEGAGAQFVSHLRVVDALPSFKQIIDNPEKTPVPTKPDAAYATMRMISANVTAETATRAFKYLGRMPQEYGAAALRHSVRNTPQLVAHPEFAVWLRANKKLLEAANLMDKGVTK